MLYAIKLPQKDGKDLYLRKFFSGELESTPNLQMAMYWPERQMAETVCAELEDATIVEMSETIYTIMRWHAETFPDATGSGQLTKLTEEVNEYVEVRTDDFSVGVEELADIFIVGCGLSRFTNAGALMAFGFVYTECIDYCKNFGNDVVFYLDLVSEAVAKKMTINRQRKWNKGNGVYKHMEE